MKKQLLIVLLVICVIVGGFGVAWADQAWAFPIAGNVVETGTGTVTSNGTVSDLVSIDGHQWIFTAGNPPRPTYQVEWTLSFTPAPSAQGQQLRLYVGAVRGGPITLTSLTYSGLGFSRTVAVGTNFFLGFNYYQYSAVMINAGTGSGDYSAGGLDTLLLSIMLTRQDVFGVDQLFLVQTPEPGTWGLFGVGALVIGAMVVRRRRHRPNRRRRRVRMPDV